MILVLSIGKCTKNLYKSIEERLKMYYKIDFTHLLML